MYGMCMVYIVCRLCSVCMVCVWYVVYGLYVVYEGNVYMISNLVEEKTIHIWTLHVRLTLCIQQRWGILVSMCNECILIHNKGYNFTFRIQDWTIFLTSGGTTFRIAKTLANSFAEFFKDSQQS